MTAQLRTRKPTGLIPYPLILIAGYEKSGKSYAAMAIASSAKVGRTFVFDIGEGGADEYAELGNYEIVEHNGTYSDIEAQVEAACAVPFDGAKPNVVVIDSGTNLWQLLKDEATKTAASRGKADPTMDLWNKANDRWRRILDRLIQFPGIAVVTARAGDTAEVEAGKPTGEKVWKVQAQKSLPYDANVVIRATGPGQAEITGVRSLQLHIPPGRALPVPNFSLEKVVFDMLKAGGGVRDLVQLSAEEVGSAEAKNRLVDAFMRTGLEKAAAKEEARKLWGGRTGAAVPVAELDRLLSSFAAPAEPTVTSAAPPTSEPETGAERPERTVTRAQASRLHAIAGRKAAPETPDDKPIDDDMLRVLIFACSNGTTDSAAGLTERQADAAEQRILAARQGRMEPDYPEVVGKWADFVEARHAAADESVAS